MNVLDFAKYNIIGFKYLLSSVIGSAIIENYGYRLLC